MTNRIKITLIAAAICFLCGCGRRNEAILIEAVQENGTEEASQTQEEEASVMGEENAAAFDTADKSIVVHVCGAVNAPGVYTLAAECRVWDAIDAAGGFSEDADTNYLNLAGTICDGQKVYVPTAGEVDPLAENGWNPLNPEQATAGSENSQRVNINTADQTALTGLPGIGEAKAKSIIAYRTEHGRFSSIEEIMEIPGIKEAVFSKIKDYITVN